MGYVVKLGGPRPGAGSEPGGRKQAAPAGRTPKQAHAGFQLNSKPVAIGAGVLLLLAVGFGVWTALGNSTPEAQGPTSDQHGIYAPPELTGAGARPGGTSAPAGVGSPGAPITPAAPAGAAPQGVYAPPELTGRR